MTLQLSLLASFLDWYFALQDHALFVVILLTMTLVATHAGNSRIRTRTRGATQQVFVGIFLGSWITLLYAFQFVLVQPDQQNVQVLLPIAGMVVSNSLSGISLGLDHWNREFFERRGVIEAWLSLGATRWEAARAVFRGALHTALLPTINSMSVAGLVGIPGLMTGQIIAGANPMEAFQYQIIIFLLIAMSVFLGALAALGFAFQHLLSPRHQVAAENIVGLQSLAAESPARSSGVISS